MSDWVMWIILGLLIVLIILLFASSAIKQKVKQKKQAKEKKIHDANTIEQMHYIHVQLLQLMIVNDKYLEKFEPSIGDFKMNDLVQTANKYLDNLQSDPNFREYIVNSDQTQLLLQYIVKLISTRSNNWAKQCTEVRKYLEDEISKIEDKAMIEEVSKKEDELISEFFEKELYRNGKEENESTK